MSELYPLKFEPVLKEKIWGGNTLAESYGKNKGNLRILVRAGRYLLYLIICQWSATVSWPAITSRRSLKCIWAILRRVDIEKFGNEFPLLIKLIEAREDLSIQVHRIMKCKEETFGVREDRDVVHPSK
jgi:mannose-6-phosphate isomerase